MTTRATRSSPHSSAQRSYLLPCPPCRPENLLLLHVPRPVLPPPLSLQAREPAAGGRGPVRAGHAGRHHAPHVQRAPAGPVQAGGAAGHHPQPQAGGARGGGAVVRDRPHRRQVHVYACVGVCACVPLHLWTCTCRVNVCLNGWPRKHFVGACKWCACWVHASASMWFVLMPCQNRLVACSCVTRTTDYHFQNTRARPHTRAHTHTQTRTRTHLGPVLLRVPAAMRCCKSSLWTDAAPTCTCCCCWRPTSLPCRYEAGLRAGMLPGRAGMCWPP